MSFPFLHRMATLFVTVGLGCWRSTTITEAITLNGFTLIDTSTSTALGTLHDGSIIDLSQLERPQLSVVVQVDASLTDGAPSSSSPLFQFVRFSLDDDGCIAQQESMPPYSLGGKRSRSAGTNDADPTRTVVVGAFAFNSVPALTLPGRHTVTAAAMDGQHNVLAIANVTFTVMDDETTTARDNYYNNSNNSNAVSTNVIKTTIENIPGLTLLDPETRAKKVVTARTTTTESITGLTLMDTETNLPLMSLNNDTVIDLAVTGRSLSIRVEIGAAASVTQVRFSYNNVANYLDRQAPYTLGYDIMPDDNSNSTMMIPFAPLSATGQHRLTATAMDDSGQVLGVLPVVFNVTDNNITTTTASLFIDARMDASILPPQQVTLKGVTFLNEPGIDIRDTAPYSPGAFETHRYGRIFTYYVTGLEANAVHQITMGWAEVKVEPRCIPGMRVFQIHINGQVVEDELDVFLRAGACYTGWMETYAVAADADGALEIEFIPILRNPMISFIHIQRAHGDNPVPPAAPKNTPSSTPLSMPTNDPSVSLSIQPSGLVISPTATAPTFIPSGTFYNFSSTGALTGELRQWHKVSIGFLGPETHEMDTPNPFTDYRLDVTFTLRGSLDHSMYTVPGFYAADGNAANSGATSGPVWLVHFSPDRTGTWDWLASFTQGSHVAQNKDSGTSAGFFDGAKGSFDVIETNKKGRDHRGKGRLQYVGKRYLQFAETGEYFLKAGSDSPENFLAYADFDNTPDNGGLRKDWAPHVQDFQDGDPTWAEGKGTGIIGAINYLSDQGMNTFSFIPMNIEGDDRNVFPYVSDDPQHFERMDVSKLAQWEILFAHADRKGLHLHFKTQEHENDQLLGGLSDQRMLYYRELIARFGHHLAVTWNLGEENTNSDQERKAFADYIRETDPYSHPIVVHTMVKEKELVYEPLLGFPSLDGASLQCGKPWEVHANVKEWVQLSEEAGKPWVCSNDEQGPPTAGVLPDAEDPDHDLIRRDVLWGTIMAGGAGVEYYFGYKYQNSDLTCEDFRSRHAMWEQSRYALEFFAKNKISLETMRNDDSAICVTVLDVCDPADENWCLTDGNTFVFYIKDGGMASVNLSGGVIGKSYSIKWYDPKNGGRLQNGSVASLDGGIMGFQSIGLPPTLTSDETKDWVVLIRCRTCA